MRVVVVAVLLLGASVARAQEEPLPPVPPPPGSAGSYQQPPPPAQLPPGSQPPPPAQRPQPAAQPPQQARPQLQPQPPQPVPQRDPDRRLGSEMVELYLTGLGLGTLGTITLMMALETDNAYMYALFPALGGTVGVATVALLDHNTRIRRGMPSSISTWSILGLGEGLLLWGAFDDRPDATGVMSLLTLSSATGALIGGVLGTVLEPEPTANRLTLTSAVWGGAIALFGALAFDWSSKPLTWRIALGGYGAGAVLGTLLGAVTYPTTRDIGLLNGAIFMGGLIGLSIAGIIHLDKRDEGGANPEVTAAGLSIGMGSGLLLGLMLVAMDAGEGEVHVGQGLPDVRLGAAPLPGGAMVSAGVSL